MINLNQFHLNCTDTIYIYDGPSVSGDPAYKLTCESKTGSVIYSSNNSLSLELVTGNAAGFDTSDFYLAYTSFNGSENGCDGFVCQDENKYCIPELNMCDFYIHCSDGSDEGDTCLKYDDNGDTVKLIALVCFASFILLLGCIWLCAHTRKIMRNRAAIQRNGVVNNN
ncbi:hypothetical protein HA402_013631 [Bradysia odoriphaga]|nr:hypothetical protein HA402_013631 [Bradysia odoriphaga]